MQVGKLKDAMSNTYSKLEVSFEILHLSDRISNW